MLLAACPTDTGDKFGLTHTPADVIDRVTNESLHPLEAPQRAQGTAQLQSVTSDAAAPHPDKLLRKLEAEREKPCQVLDGEKADGPSQLLPSAEYEKKLAQRSFGPEEKARRAEERIRLRLL